MLFLAQISQALLENDAHLLENVLVPVLLNKRLCKRCLRNLRLLFVVPFGLVVL